MSPRKHTGRSIATAVAISACASLLALGARAILFIREHVQEQFVAPDLAESELTIARARFAGHQPLIEVREGREPMLRRSERPASTTRGKTIHALIYDARSGRLIKDDVSFAVLRVFKSSGFRYLGELTPTRDDTEFERDRVDVTLGDIENHGGLVLDHHHESGSHIIIWVE